MVFPVLARVALPIIERAALPAVERAIAGEAAEGVAATSGRSILGRVGLGKIGRGLFTGVRVLGSGVMGLTKGALGLVGGALSGIGKILDNKENKNSASNNYPQNQLGSFGTAGQSVLQNDQNPLQLPSFATRVKVKSIDENTSIIGILQIIIGLLKNINSSIKNKIIFDKEILRKDEENKREDKLEGKGVYKLKNKSIENKISGDATKKDSSSGSSMLKLLGLGALALIIGKITVNSDAFKEISEDFAEFKKKYGWLIRFASFVIDDLNDPISVSEALGKKVVAPAIIDWFKNHPTSATQQYVNRSALPESRPITAIPPEYTSTPQQNSQGGWWGQNVRRNRGNNITGNDLSGGRRGRTHIGDQIRSGGTISWRNNNPGNIMWGSTARNMGAIGYTHDADHANAVFPSLDTGFSAQAKLLRSNAYKNLTIAQAAYKWTGHSAAYAGAMANAAGVTPQTRINELNDDQLKKMLLVQARHEGFKVGRVQDGDNTSIRSGEPVNLTPLNKTPWWGGRTQQPKTSSWWGEHKSNTNSSEEGNVGIGSDSSGGSSLSNSIQSVKNWLNDLGSDNKTRHLDIERNVSINKGAIDKIRNYQVKNEADGTFGKQSPITSIGSKSGLTNSKTLNRFNGAIHDTLDPNYKVSQDSILSRYFVHFGLLQ